MHPLIAHLSLACLAVSAGTVLAQRSPPAIERPTLEAPADDAEKRAAITALARVDAPPTGFMIVQPLASQYAAGLPVIRADSGRELVARHLLVRPRASAGQLSSESDSAPATPSPLHALLDQWLGPAPSLDVRELSPGTTTAALQPLIDEGWALVALVEQPVRREGTTLVVGTQRAGVRWLPALPQAAVRGELATAPVSEALRQRLLADPTEHWRLWLLTGEDPSAADAAASATDRDEAATQDPDSLLARAIAQRDIARLALALSTLQQEDAPLHARFIRRLSLQAALGDGLVLPVWPAGQALQSLWEDAADTRISPARRAQRIARWLSEQPLGAAWVQQDAQPLQAAPSPRGPAAYRAMLQLVNLDDAAQVAWLRIADGLQPAPELEPLAPLALRQVVVPHASGEQPDASSLRAPSTRAVLGLGTWSFATPLLLAPARAMPPALGLGTLRTDLSLQRWLAGDSGAEASAGSAGLGATLLRIVDGNGPAWWLVVRLPSDSRAGSPQGAGAAWRVRVELGPQRTRIEADAARDLPVGAVLDAQPDAPALWLRVPPQAIASGELLLGLTLEHAGQRASWPRALVPWQAEPSQARINLAAWDVEAR
jgi:hypothetical protein